MHDANIYLRSLRSLFNDYKILQGNSTCMISEKLKFFSLLCIVCRINALVVPLLAAAPELSEDDRVDIKRALHKVETVKQWYGIKEDSELVDVVRREYEALLQPPKQKIKLSASAEEYIPRAYDNTLSMSI